MLNVEKYPQVGGKALGDCGVSPILGVQDVEKCRIPVKETFRRRFGPAEIARDGVAPDLQYRIKIEVVSGPICPQGMTGGGR